MFQLFLRARTNNYVKERLGNEGFRRVRPKETPKPTACGWGRLASIEAVLHAAENEQAGLSRRVDDVLARAAVTIGNGTDEYLEREALDIYHQDLFTAEIANGQRRLKELAETIAHFKSVKAAMLSRFPEYKAAVTN